MSHMSQRLAVLQKLVSWGAAGPAATGPYNTTRALKNDQAKAYILWFLGGPERGGR